MRCRDPKTCGGYGPNVGVVLKRGFEVYSDLEVTMQISLRHITCGATETLWLTRSLAAGGIAGALHL